MRDGPPLPQVSRENLSPEAKAAVAVLVASLEQGIAALEERLKTNSTYSSQAADRPLRRPVTLRNASCTESGNSSSGTPHLSNRTIRPVRRLISLRQLPDRIFFSRTTTSPSGPTCRAGVLQ